jgi:hypothetical protein
LAARMEKLRVRRQLLVVAAALAAWGQARRLCRQLGLFEAPSSSVGSRMGAGEQAGQLTRGREHQQCSRAAVQLAICSHIQQYSLARKPSVLFADSVQSAVAGSRRQQVLKLCVL